MDKKIISVVVTAYNHQDYIAQCLDGILAQKGDFELEVVLGDDCSTDNTRKIMEDYRENYPHVFMLMPATANMGVTKNIQRCLKACSGDYIAFCEGDDYWTDTHKLQKQLEVLEGHPEYSMCFNAVMLYFMEEHIFEPHPKQLLLKLDTISIEDLINDNLIGNFSCCMYPAKIIKKLPGKIFDFYTVDWMFNMACAQHGKIGFMRDWMSVYRIHSKSAWSGKSQSEKYDELFGLICTYDEFFNSEYHEQFNRLKGRIAVQYCGKGIGEGTEVGPWAKAPGHRPSIIKRYAGLFMAALRNPGLLLRRIRNAVLISFSELTTGTISKMGERITDLSTGLQTQESRIVELNRTLQNEKNRIDILNSLVQARKVDLLILDTLFPYSLSRFRYEEFNSYLRHFENSKVLSTGEHLSVVRETRSINTLISEFEGRYPELFDRVLATTHEIDGYNSKLAYLLFLNNVCYFLDALEEKKIPFVFTLYPGGGFEVNSIPVDYRLRRVFKSPQFRKVIVTQRISRDYLVDNKFCDDDKIEYIFGSVMPTEVLNASKNYVKKHFGYGKDTLDICFAAMKYMPMGIDKGYDIFIEVAKKLTQIYPDIRFHVVGNFSETDIPVDGLRGKIIFYGEQQLDWFDKFYEDKDIILSPNVPFVLSKGSFDGFPTATCTEAGLRKVAVFCTDDLKLNNVFKDGEDIVVIPHSAPEIVRIIENYYKEPENLRNVAETGAAKMQEIFSFEKQMLPRIRLLENEIDKI